MPGPENFPTYTFADLQAHLNSAVCKKNTIKHLFKCPGSKNFYCPR